MVRLTIPAGQNFTAELGFMSCGRLHREGPTAARNWMTSLELFFTC